jgi:hypothetical protein
MSHLVSEVGGPDRIGFFGNGYDRKHVIFGVGKWSDFV